MDVIHTPGPWFARHAADGLGDIGIVAGAPSVSAGGVMVAEVFAEIERKGERNKQTLPNALLIAAAPDLLESLRDILRIAKAASLSHGVSGHAPRIARAEAAIAKATGGRA